MLGGFGAGVGSLALHEVVGVCSTSNGGEEQTVAQDSLGPRGEAGARVQGWESPLSIQFKKFWSCMRSSRECVRKEKGSGLWDTPRFRSQKNETIKESGKTCLS